MRMLWKRLLSYRKQTWQLCDYPIHVRKQELDASLAPRFIQHRYWAQIRGWNVGGGGATREEALAELAQCFDERKAHRIAEGEPLPRPGTEVPLEFASQERVARHADLIDDLLSNVMGIEGAWVSDESSLWDFHSEPTNDAYIAKIRELYGVDVTGIESANLAAIAEQISAKP